MSRIGTEISGSQCNSSAIQLFPSQHAGMAWLAWHEEEYVRRLASWFHRATQYDALLINTFLMYLGSYKKEISIFKKIYWNKFIRVAASKNVSFYHVLHELICTVPVLRRHPVIMNSPHHESCYGQNLIFGPWWRQVKIRVLWIQAWVLIWLYIIMISIDI